MSLLYNIGPRSRSASIVELNFSDVISITGRGRWNCLSCGCVKAFPIMRRYSPSYYSPPRRGYGGRGRSPPRRGHGGYGGRREQSHGSLLVRNVPLDCRPEDLRVPFERFGVVRDVYLPKDYYSGEPRGFAFVQFIDPHDAAEAQYHMNRQLFGGREITVVLAAETRKRPEEMRSKVRSRGHHGYEERRLSYYGRSRSRSRSPRYASRSRARQRSRSYSPAPRRANYSPSPERRHARSPRDRSPRGQDEDHHGDMRPRSSRYEVAKQSVADNVYSKRSSYDTSEEERGPRRSSPSRLRSPSGSRSRSADLSPSHPCR